MLALLLLFQTPATAAATSAPASAPASAPSDPRVEEVLAKAARAQFPEGETPEIRDFACAFDFVVRNEKGNNEVSARVDFRRPDRIRTTLDDETTGVKTMAGFDGRRYWLVDDKGTTILEGRDHRTSREEIDERIRLAQDLAALFGIRRLAARMDGLARLADETRAGRTLAVLEGTTDAFGTVRRAGVGRVRLRLHFDLVSGEVVEATATPIPERASPTPAPAPERFVFEDLRTADGYRLPRKVSVFLGDAPRAAYEVRRIRDLRVNGGLDDAVFVPPAK